MFTARQSGGFNYFRFKIPALVFIGFNYFGRRFELPALVLLVLIILGKGLKSQYWF